MNPYAELDIPPDADPTAIRRAYRRLAKATHPDHGGDPAAFHRAKRASLVLLDPARRAKFDASGEIDEDQPDNALSEVLVAIAQLLDAALVVCQQQGTDPTTVDLVDRIRRLAVEAKGNISKGRAQVEKHLALSQRIEKRFRLRATRDGTQNRMASLLAHRIASQRATLDVMTREAGKLDRAIAFLDDYAFDRDAAAPPMMVKVAPGFRISMFGQ